jgi:hypothetical protein
LGTSALQFSDLFLGEGAVINWDGGDFTATQANNLLTLSGGNTRVDRLEVDSAADYIDVSTDLQVIAAADITLDPGGNNVKPGSDNTDALGVSGTAWSDLFLGDGAVINFNAGDVTATHSSNLLSIAGGNTRVIRLEIDGANDYLDVDTDLKIISAADVVVDPGGGELKVDGNVIPNSDSADDLGASGTAWNKLWVDDIELNSQGSITNAVSASIEYISGSAASTGSFGYLKVSGDGVFGGDITFGDANTDSVSFGADISSDLIPNTDDTYDLGSASQAWQDLFLEGDITLTDAGTVATTAGGLTITSAAAATWSTSAGALTIDGAAGLTLDSDGTDAVNLGTEAVAKTITIGNAASTKVDINAIALDFDSAAATDILAASTVSVKGATGASFGDDTGTWEFSGGGALSETGMTTISMTPSSTLTLQGGGTSNFGDDTAVWSFNGSGAVSETGMTTFSLTPSSTMDIDAGGAVTIDGTSVTIGADDSGVAISIGHSTSETTINDNLTITGDLTVNGDQTIVSTTNLAVEDKFAIFASGSTSDTDGGIIVQNAASAGYALGYDSGVDRWAFDADLAHNATNLVPDAYVGVVQVATTHGDSLAVPIYGGTTNGVGTIYVDTDDNEIWIYA